MYEHLGLSGLATAFPLPGNHLLCCDYIHVFIELRLFLRVSLCVLLGVAARGRSEK